MSTAGSGLNNPPGPGYTPPPAPAAVRADGSIADDRPPNAPNVRRRRGIIRWRGLIPLTLLALAGVVLWLTIGPALLRDTMEEAATKFLGTQVDIGHLDVDLRSTTLELTNVSIADPFDPTRNLVEAGRIRAELEPRPLLEKKIVVRTLTLGDVRTNTARRTRARPAPRNGFAAQTLASLEKWTKQLERPIASFTPIDTIRAVVLDPSQLATVKEAVQLATRADSVRDALALRYRTLAMGPVYDSARAVVARLKDADPRKLGIDGTRSAITDVRRAIAQVDSAKRRVEGIATDTRAGVALLGDGVRTLDSARRADYAFAKSLLKLPSISAPDLGGALFGDVSIDRFKKFMYWAEVAQHYVPPGLLPREQPGPKRLRMAGSTVAFPKVREYPDFLLRRGVIALDVSGRTAGSGNYAAVVTNLTTMPALVREPTRFTLSRRTNVRGVSSVDAAGVLDHVGGRVRDSLGVVAGGIALPSFPLPGLPLRADLGLGDSRIDMLRIGNRVAARLVLRAPAVAWRRDTVASRRDSAAGRRVPNAVESLALRVIEGIDDLEIVADLTGDVAHPQLAVRSNLDRALADRLRAVAGEELDRAEAKVRAQVDRVVEERTAPLRERVDKFRTDAERAVDEARAGLDEQKRQLEARLKALIPGRSLLGLP
jgi:uncharacterized protein (TIGR03545 family)